VVAVGLVGGLVWLLVRAGPARLPTAEQARERIEAQVGQREATAVSALCQAPTKAGFSCRLRDGKGRYGSSTTAFTEGLASDDPDSITIQQNWLTTWSFPIDSDGRLVADLDTSRSMDVRTSIFGTMLQAQRALGVAAADGQVRCPDAPVGGTVTCAVSGRTIRRASLARTSTHRYVLDVDLALPAHDQLSPPR
jgi:hypothetical protein